MLICKFKRTFTAILLLFSILPLTCWAQIYKIPFGSFTEEEISLNECKFDKEANAVILLDEATSSYDFFYNLVTDRRVRIKILKSNGLKEANIQIPFYSDNGMESISGVEAVVLNQEEHPRLTLTSLDNNLIYTRKINPLYSEVVFALPNVKVGSIIEYKYTSTRPNFGWLDDWFFQHHLPVLNSFYRLHVLHNTEFAYNIYKSSFIPIEIEKEDRKGYITFKMRDIPALHDEAFSASAKEYKQRVSFRFAGNINRARKKEYFLTWKGLAEDLISNKNFGKQVSAEIQNIGEVKALWERETTSYGKMKVIHNYVRNNISWNNIYSPYADEGVQSTWEKKKGNSGDIALILINLLKKAGLNAFPLLVSEKNNGKVDSAYPNLNQFNKVVAFVEIDKKTYIIDGTEFDTPSFMIPLNLLNTIGFLVDKERYSLLNISESNWKSYDLVNIQGNLTDSGLIEAKALVKKYSYSRLDNINKYKKDKEGYKQNLLKNDFGIEVDSFRIDGLDLDSNSLDHNIKFKSSLKQSGNYFLLNLNWFTGFDKNPFVSEHRFTNIDFGSTYTCTLTGQFHLPSRFLLESIPKSKKLVTPGNKLTFIRDVQQKDDTLQVFLKIDINQAEFSYKDYELIKAFYKQMLDMLNEPVVLKPKQ